MALQAFSVRVPDGFSAIDRAGARHYGPPSLSAPVWRPHVRRRLWRRFHFLGRRAGLVVMKIVNSLKSLKTRHRDCRVIRRRGRVYVINKTQRRFKARQG